MARRGASTVNVPGQIDLFGGDVGEAAATPEPARQVVKSGFGGKADAALEILDQVRNGRFGILASTDRVVYLDGEGHCRYAVDDDASMVESLVVQRYAKPAAVEHMKHGVIAKAVEVLVLTPGGRGLLRRSSMLQTRRPG